MMMTLPGCPRSRWWKAYSPGASKEYRVWFSDQVASVILAHTGHDGDDLWCRQAGWTMNYAQVRHTQPEAKQVLLDMDAWELQQS